MGFIRLLLAITVLIAHSSTVFGFRFIGADSAVQCFFMISGFLMTFVLKGKYAKKPNWVFWRNRLMKIFPLYWVLLIITLIFSITSRILFGDWLSLSPLASLDHSVSIAAAAFFAFSNIAIFGQDLLLFSKFNSDGSLGYSSNFWTGVRHMPWEYMLIPQAWSLVLEMMFYLLAPKIVKMKTNSLIIIAIISFFIRIWLYENGLNHDPWTYRFFPTELLFFILGVLSYKLYSSLRLKYFYQKNYSIIFIFSLLFIVFYQFITIDLVTRKWILFVIFFISLPSFFVFSKKNTFDRRMGEYSYPFYISHYFIINILRSVGVSRAWLGILSVLFTMVFSWLLIKIVVMPIDKFRNLKI